MISPGALEEAALAAGWWRGFGKFADLWYFTSDPPGLPITHPLVLSGIASHLKAQVAGSAEMGAHPDYYLTAHSIDPKLVLVGAAFLNDEAIIACAMVALRKWKAEHARLVYRGGG